MRLSKATLVDYDRWIGERIIASPSTNIDSRDLPFQSWKPFKEAFSPEIVHRAIRETPGLVTRLVDPFGGSGTSALTSQMLGVKPTTIEVNPFLADLIEAKLTKYNLVKLTRQYAKVIADLKTTRKGRPGLPKGLPPTFIEPGVNGRYIFPKLIAARLNTLLCAIENNCDQQISRLFRVLTASISIEVSNIVISGKGRRYRNNWKNREFGNQDVDELFERVALSAIKDISGFGERKESDFTIKRGNSVLISESVGEQDVAVFSPPYPNSFDYTDVYNVELWLLGYLKSADDNKNLRRDTLRSHVQVERDYETDTKLSSKLTKTYKQLSHVRDDLWNHHIPEMVVSYFKDMESVYRNLSKSLRRKGRLYCVVGDSKYGGVSIPVSQILVDVGEHVGFKLQYTEEFRSMRVSPQQGGNKELAETLLVFST